MTVEERLASLEAKVDALTVLMQGHVGRDTHQIETSATLQADIKMLRVGVALALLGGLGGGGSSLILKLLGG